MIAVKESFTREARALSAAIAEIERAGWTDGVVVEVFEGPGEYLYGEETGLLEVIDGRHPFPRVAPPYRHGRRRGRSRGDRRAPDAREQRGDDGQRPRDHGQRPELVPGAGNARLARHDRLHGERAHRRTPASASSRWARRSRQIIDEIGGGARRAGGWSPRCQASPNPLVTAAQFDTPASHEAMNAIGSGLGAAGFIVFDDATDFAELAYGVSRFLAVESCGQCTPCKEDGLALADIFDRVRRSEAERSRPALDRRSPPHDHRKCALLPRHATPARDRQHRRARR